MNTIYGFGNALVDIEIRISEIQLQDIEIKKGSMKHIATEELTIYLETYSKNIHSKLPGGSIANSLYAANKHGAKTHYSCSLGDDEYGQYFIDSFKDELGDVSYSRSNLDTGICLIFVTPDGQRTMAAHLGANLDLSPKSLNIDKLKQSKYLLFDNFSLSTNNGLSTAQSALEESADLKICFGISDASLIEENLSNLMWLSSRKLHMLYGNQIEMSAIKKLISMNTNNTLVTDGENGARYNEQYVEAPKINMINSNGAGDALIGTFLSCLENSDSIESLMKSVNYASKVCSANGPRLL
ncbi:PfkB family carbohydrate kinase [Gammaproteobacteria bacterium]|nr:hypothetical protein [SAR86 cluster bacterium]MDC0577180.1 PfkB family carbohydrate kinase [Gammaproteobacteria bacterium]MDC1251712.1 PfkB family carbohydrate kinase [Gammaproteobacteria bacterium]MDC3323371.1 PfkB family carbohydrate kinase [Gammaproteobacteria bacterium]|tara:strand:- start:10626 stop:11519 length:894 start_codon:yes stop_codon:yes gene_type:complete